MKNLADVEIHRLDAGHFEVDDNLDYILSEIYRFYAEKVTPNKYVIGIVGGTNSRQYHI